MGAEHAARPGDTEQVFLDSRIPASSLFVHRNMIRYRLTRFFAELTNEPDNRSCEEPSISEVIHEAAGEVLDQETVGVAPVVEQRGALNVGAVRVIQNHRKFSACSLPASLRLAMSLNPQIAKHRSSSAKKDFR